MAGTSKVLAGFLSSSRRPPSDSLSSDSMPRSVEYVRPAPREVEPCLRHEDRRTPEELLDLIEAKGREVAEAVATLRALRSGGASAADQPREDQAQDRERNDDR